MEMMLIQANRIRNSIYLIRDQKVILDRDLAALYGVGTKVLKQAVKRNHKRFPDDFMFVLNQDEFEKWRSQNVTSISDRMGLRYAPMAFTERGVVMLSYLSDDATNGVGSSQCTESSMTDELDDVQIVF